MTARTDDPKVLSDPPPVPSREAVQRWRLVLARGSLDDAAQREQQASWEAALVDSGLPLAGLELARPRPRFALAAPLAAAIPGEAELLDLFLVERLPAWRVREALEAVVPGPYRLLDAYDVWLGEAPLPGRVAASVYRARFTPGDVDAASLSAAAAGLLASTVLPRERRKGDVTIAYDLRPFISGLDVEAATDRTVARMTLRHDPERGVGRPDELLAALGDAVGRTLEPAELVRERLVLGDPPPPRQRARQGAASPSRPRT